MIALYARVSTQDRGQDPETQLTQLRQVAGEIDARAYVDHASAGDLRGRTAWRELFDDCRRGAVERIYVTKIDRAWQV